MVTPEERADLTREITEHILLLLPGVIAHLINNISTLKDLSIRFYETNKDLVNHKQLVGMTIEQLEMKHPDKSAQDILDIAASEVKNILVKQKQISSVGNL